LVSDSQTIREMSDNRYTLRLKPRQKEWVQNTANSASLIRTFIDSEIAKGESGCPLDIESIRYLMENNLSKIRRLQEDRVFNRCSNNIEMFEKYGFRSFINKFIVDIEKPKREPKTFDLSLPNIEGVLRGYIARCKSVVDVFEGNIEALYLENRKLEQQFCQTNTIVSDSPTAKPIPLQEGSQPSHDSRKETSILKPTTDDILAMLKQAKGGS